MMMIVLLAAESLVTRARFVRRYLRRSTWSREWLVYLSLKAKLLDDVVVRDDILTAATHCVRLEPHFKGLLADLDFNTHDYLTAALGALEAASLETTVLYRIRFLLLAASSYIGLDDMEAGLAVTNDALALFASHPIQRYVQDRMYYYANYFAWSCASAGQDSQTGIAFLKRAASTWMGRKLRGEILLDLGRAHFGLKQYEIACDEFRRAMSYPDVAAEAGALFERCERLLPR